MPDARQPEASPRPSRRRGRRVTEVDRRGRGRRGDATPARPPGPPGCRSTASAPARCSSSCRAPPRTTPSASAPATRWSRQHLPLVEHLARRFRNRGEPYDDLVQVGDHRPDQVGRPVRPRPRRRVLDVRDADDRRRDQAALPRQGLGGPGARAGCRSCGCSLDVGDRASSPRSTAGRRRSPSSPRTSRSARRRCSRVWSRPTPTARSRSTPATRAATTSRCRSRDTLGVEDEALEGVEYRESLKPLLEQLPPREKTDPAAAVLPQHDAVARSPTRSASRRCTCRGCSPGPSPSCARACSSTSEPTHQPRSARSSGSRSSSRRRRRRSTEYGAAAERHDSGTPTYQRPPWTSAERHRQQDQVGHQGRRPRPAAPGGPGRARPAPARARPAAPARRGPTAPSDVRGRATTASSTATADRRDQQPERLAARTQRGARPAGRSAAPRPRRRPWPAGTDRSPARLVVTAPDPTRAGTLSEPCGRCWWSTRRPRRPRRAPATCWPAALDGRAQARDRRDPAPRPRHRARAGRHAATGSTWSSPSAATARSTRSSTGCSTTGPRDDVPGAGRRPRRQHQRLRPRPRAAPRPGRGDRRAARRAARAAPAQHRPRPGRRPLVHVQRRPRLDAEVVAPRSTSRAPGPLDLAAHPAGRLRPRRRRSSSSVHSDRRHPATDGCERPGAEPGRPGCTWRSWPTPRRGRTSATGRSDLARTRRSTPGSTSTRCAGCGRSGRSARYAGCSRQPDAGPPRAADPGAPRHDLAALTLTARPAGRACRSTASRSASAASCDFAVRPGRPPRRGLTHSPRPRRLRRQQRTYRLRDPRLVPGRRRPR